MLYSQYIQMKTARLVRENQASQIFQGAKNSIIIVKRDEYLPCPSEESLDIFMHVSLPDAQPVDLFSHFGEPADIFALQQRGGLS